MKAIIIHNHIVINIPRKGKQVEPTKEQMMAAIDKQLNYLTKQITLHQKMRETIEAINE